MNNSGYPDPVFFYRIIRNPASKSASGTTLIINVINIRILGGLQLSWLVLPYLLSANL